MWKKKEAKKEEEVVVEENLLKELCCNDVKLYDFLTNHLVVDPASGISEKSIDILTEEGEKSGNFTQAVDKAIFEGAQHPGERDRYIKLIQTLALKTIHTAEIEKEKVEKQGLTDRAASIVRRIENQKFMNDRAEDIVKVASTFYHEKLLVLEEDKRREARGLERREAEREEQRIGETERASREARKKEIKKLGGEAKKEAEKQEKREELAAEERREARATERTKIEMEEQRIDETEKAGRDVRKKERENN